MQTRLSSSSASFPAACKLLVVTEGNLLQTPGRVHRLKNKSSRRGMEICLLSYMACKARMYSGVSGSNKFGVVSRVRPHNKHFYHGIMRNIFLLTGVINGRQECSVQARNINP